MPSVDRQEFLRLMRAFEQSALEYVLIGATAMGLHGVLRATEDIDLMLRASAENFARLRSALRIAYPEDPHIEELKDEDWLGEYPVVRFAPRNSTLYMDLLVRLGDAATIDSIESQSIDLEGIRVSIATPLALYRLKKGTVRPIDQQDARMLAEAFDLKDES